jgi:hypothetical protein
MSPRFRALALRCAALLLGATLATGCAPGSGSDDDGPEVADPGDGKADSTRPLGIYGADYPDEGTFVDLTLNEDKTYVARRHPQLGTGRPRSESGTYRYTSSGSTRYIRFLDASGVDVGRFAYELNSDRLHLRQTGQKIWTFLTRELAPAGSTTKVACIDGSRKFSVVQAPGGGTTLTGYFKNFESLEPDVQQFDCTPWTRGTIKYRCWGDTSSPPFYQINLLRFASGTPGVEFELVNEKNEVGGDSYLFSFNCGKGSKLDF